MNGRSLSISSISVTIVWSSGRRMFALPKTYLRATLVIPKKRSQRPQYQGARFGINFHSTVYLMKCVSSIGDFGTEDQF